MQPEISHRCTSCGVAVRDPAMFCPECGKPLAVAATAPSGVSETNAEKPEPVVASAATVSTDKLANTAAPTVETTSRSTAAEVASDPKSVPDQKDPDGESDSKTGARAKTRERLHRAGSAATSVARHALDDNVKRVEKIHHVSSAMFEEAAYDPSLRFVLVALGLFIVAVILLVLSKVMG